MALLQSSGPILYLPTSHALLKALISYFVTNTKISCGVLAMFYFTLEHCASLRSAVFLFDIPKELSREKGP